MFAVGFSGLWGMKQSNEGLRTVYEDRTVPALQLADIQHHQLQSQLAIDRALLGNRPEALASAVQEVEANMATITRLWTAYVATYLTPEEKVLADRFRQSQARFVERRSTHPGRAKRCHGRGAQLSASRVTRCTSRSMPT